MPALLPHIDVFWTADPRLSRAATLEAMAARRAIVGDESDWDALSGDAGLTVAPGDRAQRAIATRRLLDNPSSRSQLGEAARRRVEQEFSAERMATAYRGAYLGK